ncbi:MAG TPA: FtsQ-type POTRA domain-containing protein [Thermoanaerobaculia bacterium]|nr:FtsQ-type POTRA domain-containing protein [Thermoanaerobaculia bacterium]
MNIDSTASRFLRPTDLQRLRRNQRRIQVQRVMVWLRNGGLAAVLILGGLWAWRHTQSDPSFAVRTIEIDGAVHTPPAALQQATQRYTGLNLFQIDIARVQHDLRGLGWVRRIDIEKKLPDTLRIKITERKPVAIARAGERLLYVDDEGTAFADLTPSVGDDDLPLISDAQGSELTRSVAFLVSLRKTDAALFARVSEVWPIAPRGFALYDRELGAVVYANAEDVSAKYRNLRAVLGAEASPKIEYADLRFADRVIVKALETNHVQN